MKNQKKNKYSPKPSNKVETAFEQHTSNPLLNNNQLQNKWMQAAILFVFSIVLYANTINCQYTLDDMLMITSNKFTKEGFSGIKNILYHDTFVGFFGENKNLLPGGRYRPLSQVMFAMEYQFFGLNPMIGHFNNILMYGLLNVFLFFTLRRLFKPPYKTDWFLSMPFLITALFVAHPLHTEVVANIKGRDEIMSLMASLGTLWFILNYIDTRKIHQLIIASGIFVLALLCKENAITFFAVIPLVLFFFFKPKLEDYIFSLAALTCGIAIYLVAFRYPALGFILGNGVVEKELLNNPFVQATTGDKYATILYTWGLYIKLLILPHPLTHDYYPKQIPIVSFSDIRAIFSIVLYLALTVFAFKHLAKKSLIASGIFFFLITFSIQSNLVFNIGAFMNERFMFISLLGFCIIVAWFLTTWLKQKIKDAAQYKSIVTAIIVILLSAYSLKTFTRNFVWKDDFTLFTSDVLTSTNSAKVNVSAGGMLIEKAVKEKDSLVKIQLLNRAIPYLVSGVHIHKGHVAGWILLGNAYMHLNNYETSRRYYDTCLQVNPKHPDAITNLKALGQNCIAKKQYIDGKNAYLTLLHYAPNDLPSSTMLADCYANTGRPDSAVYLLKQVIAKDPVNAQAYNKLGQVYGQFMGNLAIAIVYLEKAYSLKKDDASILENLGVACGINKDYSKSATYFELAIKYKKDNAQLYGNLANTYLQMGRTDLAQKNFKKMQELKSQGK